MRDARKLTMSARELDRLQIIVRVVERRLTLRQAAEQLGLGLRQVQRLCRGYRQSGPAASCRGSVDVQATGGCPRPFEDTCWNWSEVAMRILDRRWRTRNCQNNTTLASRSKP